MPRVATSCHEFFERWLHLNVDVEMSWRIAQFQVARARVHADLALCAAMTV